MVAAAATLGLCGACCILLWHVHKAALLVRYQAAFREEVDVMAQRVKNLQHLYDTPNWGVTVGPYSMNMQTRPIGTSGTERIDPDGGL